MKRIEKYFDALTAGELYEILKARAEVFVVEQNCVYQDLDGNDYNSLHLFFQEDDGTIAAYLRIFPAEEPGAVKMGRVLTVRRGIGLGGRLLRDGIAAAGRMPGVSRICIEAQSYAVDFYRREGFTVVSDEFLEDGIPHVRMTLELPHH